MNNIIKSGQEREEYLDRQWYADTFWNTPDKRQSREFFLELIDKAMLDGAKKYQDKIKRLAKESSSWKEFSDKLLN